MKFMFRNDTEFNKLEASVPKIQFSCDLSFEANFADLVSSGNLKKNFKSSSSSFGFYVSDTWMCLELGEGEKEIENHGWSRVKEVFSQETGAVSQQCSAGMMSVEDAKMQSSQQHSKSQVQDAHDSPTQLPHFFSLNWRPTRLPLEG